MIQLHVTYTMKPGIHPKAFFDALNAANIPSLCRHEKGNIRYSYYLPADNDNQLFLLELTDHQQTSHFLQIPSIKEKYVAHTDLQRFEFE